MVNILTTGQLINSPAKRPNASDEHDAEHEVTYVHGGNSGHKHPYLFLSPLVTLLTGTYKLPAAWEGGGEQELRIKAQHQLPGSSCRYCTIYHL